MALTAEQLKRLDSADPIACLKEFNERIETCEKWLTECKTKLAETSTMKDEAYQLRETSKLSISKFRRTFRDIEKLHNQGEQNMRHLIPAIANLKQAREYLQNRAISIAGGEPDCGYVR